MKKDFGILISRVLLGGMMLFAHGWPKLLNYAEYSQRFPDPFGVGSQTSLILAIFSEVFCALFLVLGLFTRWVSLPLLITMLVAAFIVHGEDPWSKKEFALLYAVPFLSFLFTGGGRYSFDSAFLKKS